jgi:hypothetical protein
VESSNTSSIENPKKEYWTTLGEFIEAFSLIEYHIFTELCQLLAISIENGRSIFGKTRTLQIVDHITSYYSNSETGMPPRTKLAMDQIKVIARIRNDLVHWAATHNQDGILTIRDFKDPKPRRHQVSPAILRNAIEDMGRIHDLIRGSTSQSALLPGQPDPELQVPWRCKPLPPAKL